MDFKGNADVGKKSMTSAVDRKEKYLSCSAA
jgi:hypothetical protein